jgi:acyl phosphate:glycerol-3-phosphate acyltransferase
LEKSVEFNILGLGLLSYLAGGIPTGYLLARRYRGIDIREHGSGNPGAANVYRVCGRGPGAATLFVDAAKGFLPVMLAQRLHPDRPWVALLCGALAIGGHDWTIFLGFKGGKGVATSAGVFGALMPKVMALILLVFASGVAYSRHISVGSMAAAAALPMVSLAARQPRDFSLLALGAGALILYKHIPNLKRLRDSRELSFREKKY